MSIVQKAVETVAKLMPDKAPDPLIGGRFGAVGQPVSRIDGPLKVTGGARFAAEVRVPGLAYAAIVCSTIAKGRIGAIELGAAEKAPGVIGIMTHENAPRMKAPPIIGEDANGASFSKLEVMQDDAIRWNGEAVAVVLAGTQEEADHAASLVRASYLPEEAHVDFHAELPNAKPPENILGQPSEVKKGGDAEAALREAPAKVDLHYETPRHSHNPIELHAVTAVWEGEKLTLHDATQMLALTVQSLAAVFDVSAENIRVLSPFVGGGFGSKGFWSHTMLAVAAAKLFRRPVRMVLSREGVFRLVGGRAPSVQRVALGAHADGRLASLIHTGTTGVVSHNAFPEQFCFPARLMYAADNLVSGQTKVELDTVCTSAMRAPGESIGTFALESALDELAHDMKIDPVELRRRIEPEKDPVGGKPYSSRHLVEAYAEGAQRFGWAKRDPVPGRRRDGEWRIGMGCASGTYPYYRRPGSAARIRIAADGSAVVEAAAHEMGMGTATVQAQAAADRLGLPLEKVRFDYGDSDFPESAIAGGSAQSASIAAAVIAAFEALAKELIRLAGNDSPLAGASVADVVGRDGGLFRTDASGGGESYESILRRAGRDHVEAEAKGPATTELIKYSMHSYSALFAEVRVSSLTGEIRVSRFLGSFDTGRILNPKTARSQFRGGIIMGLGMALMEETLLDARSGRIMNPSLAEYHVPVHMDVPEIDVIWTDIPDPHTPLGLHGVGEIGITGVAAAVANAVFNATGVRVRELPITLDKVMKAEAA